MSQLTQALVEVEEKLISLLEEVRSLRPYIKSLEEENIRLKRESYALPVRLYREGFHVCHLHFGQPLEVGACLFCAGFLRRE